MEKIRKYVDSLFKDTPKTKQVRELKEEFINDLEEKYSDLVSSGKEEKEAYQEVISGIGDMDTLLSSLQTEDQIQNLEYRKKTALAVSSSVGIYILSLVAVIVLSELNVPDYASVSAFLLLVGVATCILIYHFISTPKYIKKEETLVEDFKEWKNAKDKNKEIRSAISSILWTLTVIVYLLISFIWSIWPISWIIFLVAALLEGIVNLIFKLKEY